MKKRFFVVLLVCCLLSISAQVAVSSSDNSVFYKPVFRSKQYIELPSPSFPDTILEVAIAQRKSIRQFTDQPVSLENISTVLWGIHGYNGTKSIETFDGRNVLKVYVLLENGTYEYIPTNHSLALYRKGDYRKIGQYDTAAFKLGFVWDTDVCKNQSVAASEIGMIGQNVYLMANALGLATVTTASETLQLYLLGLPSSEKPMIIMPIGYPKNPYNFTYKQYESGLPFPINSTTSFVDAVSQKQRWAYLSGELSENVLSQELWAGYGTSYLYDNLNNKSHRSVPSSNGVYPLEILFANSSGLYKYEPINHSLAVLSYNDVREDIASASFPWVSSTDVFIIALNTSKSSMSWAWYYEAGAIWHNMLLEAATFGLSANVLPGFDSAKIIDDLNLTGLKPLVMVQIGDQNGTDDQNPEIVINTPEPGFLYLFGSKIKPFSKTVVVGKLRSEVQVSDESLLLVQYFINDKLFAEQYWGPTQTDIPSFFFRNCEYKVVATDYFKNLAEVKINFIKIL